MTHLHIASLTATITSPRYWLLEIMELFVQILFLHDIECSARGLRMRKDDRRQSDRTGSWRTWVIQGLHLLLIWQQEEEKVVVEGEDDDEIDNRDADIIRA